MGPLLTADVLQSLQATFGMFKSYEYALPADYSQLDSGKPALFSQQFKRSLEDMSPQNSRAFAATIKLLSELVHSEGASFCLLTLVTVSLKPPEMTEIAALSLPASPKL